MSLKIFEPLFCGSEKLRSPDWGPFSCPEIRAFMGFGARFLQPFPKSLVTVKYYLNTKKIAGNGR